MPSARSISRLRKIDWDFPGSSSESPFSSVHWYPCRFVSQIPAAIIGILSQPGETVLDPFVGSGTTLVECQRLGRPSIGIDINPIACVAAGAKTLSSLYPSIVRWIGGLERDAQEALNGPLLSKDQSSLVNIPESVQRTKWYTRKVTRDLGVLWEFIEHERGQRKQLAEAAFSAILLKVCRETRHWGYVCDNTSPKSNHEEDVGKEFIATLGRFKVAYEERDRELRERFPNGFELAATQIHCGDAREKLREIPKGSVELVVTSPPYFGVSDYIKAQRLSMEWFGKEIEPFRQREIGARSKRHRHTSLEEYLSEIREVFAQAYHCLRPGGSCVIVIGESSSRAPYIDKFLETVLSCGFELRRKEERRVSAQRRMAPSILQEQILILGT